MAAAVIVLLYAIFLIFGEEICVSINELLATLRRYEETPGRRCYCCGSSLTASDDSLLPATAVGLVIIFGEGRFLAYFLTPLTTDFFSPSNGFPSKLSLLEPTFAVRKQSNRVSVNQSINQREVDVSKRFLLSFLLHQGLKIT